MNYILPFDLLLEQREDILNMISKHGLSAGDVKYLREIDPSKGKFLPWLIKQWTNPNADFGRRERDFLNDYYKLYLANQLPVEQRDINRLSVEDLKQISLLSTRKLSRNEQDTIGKDGAVKVFENDRILLLHLKTWEAAKKYGKGTRWCISSKDYPGDFDVRNINWNMFVIFLKDRTDDNYKLCLIKNKHSHEMHVYNAVDVSETYYDFLYTVNLFDYGVDVKKVIYEYLGW